jgi:hypothetical protein
MSEILFQNFQLWVCCGLLHQLSVAEISDPFCHSVGTYVPAIYRNLLSVKVIFYSGKYMSILFSPAI